MDWYLLAVLYDLATRSGVDLTDKLCVDPSASEPSNDVISPIVSVMSNRDNEVP